jgi:hypothetical protein
VLYFVPVAHTTVLNSNGQVATLVEAPEFRVRRVLPDLESTRHGLLDRTDLLFANSQRGARATGRVLVGRVSRALVILWARHLGRVAKLCDGIVVVRVVLRVRLLGKCRASTTKPAPSTMLTDVVVHLASSIARAQVEVRAQEGPHFHHPYTYPGRAVTSRPLAGSNGARLVEATQGLPVPRLAPGKHWVACHV